MGSFILGKKQRLFRGHDSGDQAKMSHRSDEKKLLIRVVLFCAIVAAGIVYAFVAAHARDLGQWTNTDPVIHKWYETLMQPDNSAVSCCGESDSYWADGFEQQDGQYVAIITDERPDEPLKRPHKDIGTKIVVPNHKIKWDQSNPTGHGVIFLTRGDYVYCYVPPGGV